MSQEIYPNDVVIKGTLEVANTLLSGGSDLYDLFGNDVLVDAQVRSLTANWESAYSTVQSNSATNWSNTLSNNFTQANFLPLSGGNLAGSVTLSTSSSNDAFRITQSGSGNALVVEDSENPDSTPLVVNQYGQIISGSLSAWGSTAGFQLNSDSSSAPNANMALRRNTNDRFSTNLIFVKARGTLNSSINVQSNDILGTVQYNGYLENNQGTNNLAAQIRGEVDGTPVNSLSSIPGRLTFWTTTSGDATATEKMRITHDGKVGIGTTSPNELLTVAGNISASGTTFASGGNSNNWNSVYSTVQSNSATNWNYQGTDLKALSSNWESTYTTFTNTSSSFIQTDVTNSTPGLSSITKMVAVSALPLVQEVGTMYVLI